MDASYEAVGKRTFLAMSIMILTHLICLVIFIGLYSKFKASSQPALEPFQAYDYSSSSDESSD